MRSRFAGSGKRGHGPVNHLVFFFQTFHRFQMDQTVVLERLTRAHHLFDTRRKRANPSATYTEGPHTERLLKRQIAYVYYYNMDYDAIVG